MGPGGSLCRLSRAQARELEARMRYRPGVVQGFLASAGLGLVFFSVTSGLDEVQDGLRPQAEIKGGEANPVP
jgi:hypothetical protein